MNGESGAIVGTCDDEPTCMHTTISRSFAAAITGSQYRSGSWMVGQAERRRVLREAERGRALRRAALHLLGRERRVPHRDQRQRDVATGRAAAPLVDHPVVVRLQADEPELAVARLHEQLAAEAGDRREAQRRQHAGPVHVFEPRHRVVAPGSHLAVRQRLGAELLLRLAHDRAQPRARVALAVVDPVVEPVVVELHVRGTVAVLRRDAVDPHVGRFQHVVVDRDQPVEVVCVVIAALRSPCASPLGRHGCRRAPARGRARSACSHRPARRR